jgi:hypothetical protein
MKAAIALVIACVVLLLLVAAPASATLIQKDFLTPGDGLLVLDDTTNIEWLSPVASRGITFNDIQTGAGGFLTVHGFEHATLAAVSDLVADNFGGGATAFPGDAIAFTTAQNLFDMFGVVEHVMCGTSSGVVPCPRTFGLTADPIGVASHVFHGAIQLGAAGWILTASLGDTNGSSQVGHWLVRDAAPVPVPASIALVIMGMACAWIAAGGVSGKRR